MQLQDNPCTTRNVVIFALIVIASGWLGYGLDQAMNNLPAESLGKLLWLVLPLLSSLFLRAVTKDGWRDFGLRPNLKGNGIGYATSLLIYPIGATLVVAIGGLLGLITFTNFSASRLLSVFIAGLAPSFIKNIFEEFSWRGFLTPKIKALVSNDYTGHGIVGLIWAGWHIPYWLFYIDRTLIAATTPQDMALFIFMAVINLVVASIAYGELRLLTRSVWPPVIMHAISNALIDVLAIEGLIQIKTGASFLVSPGHQSVLTLLFFVVGGVGLHWWRVTHSDQSVDS